MTINETKMHAKSGEVLRGSGVLWDRTFVIQGLGVGWAIVRERTSSIEEVVG